MNGCWTCGWAEWGKTKAGRKDWRKHGRCLWPIPVIDWPWSITVRHLGMWPVILRSSFWKGDGVGCPCWKKGG